MKLQLFPWIAVVLSVAGRPLAAQNQFKYSSDNQGITVTRYIGSGGAVVIPDIIDHLPVVSIGAGAFARQISVTRVVIPDTVTNIGDEAFTYMDTHSRLTALKMGRRVARIGRGAFSGCDQLKRITIPDSVVCIGSEAFVFCNKLTGINIPAGVTNIEDGAFNACFSLQSITVAADNPAYCSVDGILYNEARTRLLQFPSGKAGGFVIPNGITNIAHLALWNCPYLTSVKIPEGVPSIGDEEFAACGRLATIIVPASVTNIGPNAFDSCVSMRGIYFWGNAPDYGEFWRGGKAKILGGLDTGTIYYRQGTTGWEKTFGGRPTAFWEPYGKGESGLNLQVAITRYASVIEAQVAIKESLRLRQMLPASKQNYKGATIYRYGDDQVLICQADDYVIEVNAFGIGDMPLTMKVLDAILEQLDYHRDVRPDNAVTTTTVKLRFVGVDSEETNSEDGYGENAVDGNPNTYWHTQWQGNSPGLPHEIILELVPPAVIKGFTYLPRQDLSDHGTIKDYEFYVSDDGMSFGQPIKKGSFEPGKGEKIETFKPIKCHFIKLRAISEINGLPWTSAAEIGVIAGDEDASVKDYWRGNIGRTNETATAWHDSTRPDEIDSFVAVLTADGGLWQNGVDEIGGTQAVSPEEVVSETLRKAKFKTGLMTSYQILEIRKIHIGEFPDAYTAVLVDTNLGRMILLIQYDKGKDSTPGHWWRRIYDVSPEIKRLY